MNWKKSIRKKRERKTRFFDVVVVARKNHQREKMSMLPLTPSSSSLSQKGRRRKITLATATASAIVACISCVFLSLFLYDIDDLEDAHEGRRTTIKTRRPKTSFDASFHRGHDDDETTRKDDDDEKKEKTNDAKTFRRHSSFPYRYVGVLKYVYLRAKD